MLGQEAGALMMSLLQLLQRDVVSDGRWLVIIRLVLMSANRGIK